MRLTNNWVYLIDNQIKKFLSTEAKGKIKGSKKVWNITLGRADDGKGFTIKLNNSNLKTPLKNLLRVQDETLALAITNEWRSKADKKKLDLKTMHLTTMAYDAIDNPFNESTEEVVDSIIEYLKFDTIRFRDAHNEELLHKQSRFWDPMIGWFEHKYECHVPIEYGDIMSTGELPKITQEKIVRNLGSHGRWPLIGVRCVAQNLKSFVLATSLMERFLRVEQAVEIARLETRHQTEMWSKVEWEHDIDEQCTNSRVAAGTLFYHLTV